MNKDNKKRDCLGGRSFKSDINLLIAHFFVGLVHFFGKNIFGQTWNFGQNCQNIYGIRNKTEL